MIGSLIGRSSLSSCAGRVGACDHRAMAASCPPGTRDRTLCNASGKAMTAHSRPCSIGSDMSVNAREVVKERVSILRNARQHGASRELLHGDQLAFE